MATQASAHASPLALPTLGSPSAFIQSLPDPAAKPIPYIVTAVLLVVTLYSLHVTFSTGLGSPPAVPNKQVPLVSWTPTFDVAGVRQLMDFLHNAYGNLVEGHKKYRGKPYRMYTDSADVTVLPPSLVDEIKNDPRLTFDGSTRRAFHAHLRGFDLAGNFDVLVKVVRQDLVRELAKVTKPLSEEAAYDLHLLLGEDKNWHQVELRPMILQLVARLSSRVFLGDELCRDSNWLKITINNTITSMTACAILRMFPRFMRPLVHQVLPQSRQVLAEQRAAASLINPILEKRRQLKAKLEAEGASSKELKEAFRNDGIEWFERAMCELGRPYRPEHMQISLSTAAIHTTSDLFSQLILDIAGHPEIFAPLREEIRDVLGREGWAKTSLYNLKLLDSCIRETQRKKPITITSMRREVLADMTLSDGTFLRKGSEVMVSSMSHWDPEVYENPEEWDGFRFYNMRKDLGHESAVMAVTTSPNHTAFGHGQHSCPGRFFAINEVKVAMAHMLMKYDWRLAEGTTGKAEHFGLALTAEMKAKIEVRRREPDVDLDNLRFS